MVLRREWWLGRAYREADPDADGGTRPSPAQVNQEGNRRRLSRIEEIARGAEANRARNLEDVEGENATGRFQGGELDDSPEARERAAELEEQAAEDALAEQTRAAQEAERLQGEGADEEAAAAGRSGDDQAAQSGDEKLINGVKHYLTIINGQERWMTLKQLREHATQSGDAERALQQAQEALQRSTDASLRAQPGEEEAEPDEAELENVVLSAVMGDGEAVKKLVSALKRRSPGISTAEVSRQVSQQLATQRALDTAEAAEAAILGNPTLAPIFRMRLNEFAREKPNTKIEDAYKAVGQGMRKDFAPMLANAPGSAPSKEVRKRSIVLPPGGAQRQPLAQDPDREVPVSSTIDEIAKSRGQDRAIRRRS